MVKSGQKVEKKERNNWGFSEVAALKSYLSTTWAGCNHHQEQSFGSGEHPVNIHIE